MQNCSKYQYQTAVRKLLGFWSRQHRRRQSTTQQAGSNLPPALPARGGPREPPVTLAEKEKEKVCLQVNRRRSSTLGIGTVYTAFSILRVKASGSLPRKQSQRTAKPTAFYALSATHKKGVVKPRLLKIRGRITKKYAVSALLRGVVQESRAVSEGT